MVTSAGPAEEDEDDDNLTGGATKRGGLGLAGNLEGTEPTGRPSLRGLPRGRLTTKGCVVPAAG